MNKKLLIIGILLISMFSVSAIQETCEKTYFLIVETNYQYTQQDLDNLGITQEFIDNYIENCYIQGYSDIPPEKIEVEEIVFYKNLTDCPTEIDNFFDLSIPLPNIFIGELNCSETNKLRWIFRMERIGDYTTIKGLRAFLVFSVFVLIVVLSFIKSNSWLNRMIKRKKREYETFK